MKRPLIQTVCATVPSECEFPFIELLSGFFGSALTSYTDLELGKTTVTIYPGKAVQWTPAIEKQLAAEWRAFETGYKWPGFSRRKLKPSDWANSWKRHFHPLKIGRKLLVKPPWKIPIRASDFEATVILEPGLSFGTGQHPTTEFCLREIARLAPRPSGPAPSFLDMGTGSGILAIAAAKLGYRPVDAFDFDPVSIEVATKNACRNRTERKISFSVQDVTKLPVKPDQTFDLVCANLISNVLVQNKKRIAARVAPGGKLVVAGILATEFQSVCLEFEATGFILLRTKRKNEWQSGTLVRREK